MLELTEDIFTIDGVRTVIPGIQYTVYSDHHVINTCGIILTYLKKFNWQNYVKG
jgi:hypothetical protein